MKLALKIDVDTYRGTLAGVPQLLRLLDAHQIQATFLFSLGPDHTGRALKRIFRPGFFSKVQRTSVLRHYGVRTLLYGVLLPGPDIGKRCQHIMRAVQAAGHEVGIHTWDHVAWQDGVASASAAWTELHLRHAVQRFTEIFDTAPLTHGAAGWQMNAHAFKLTARLGLQYASDTRGSTPFMPYVDNAVIPCAQLPTTLPTLDELIGVDGIHEDNVTAALLARTHTATHPHVYTLHAELEGMQWAPIFKNLLDGWRAQGYTLTSTQQIFADLDLARLPIHEVTPGCIPGRSGTVMLQAAAVAVAAISSNTLQAKTQ